MTSARTRRAIAVLLTAGAAAGALSGCTPDAPVENRAVITVADARVRYLDATCPLRADPRFWRPIEWTGRADAARTASALLPVADAAVEQLTGADRPWPRQLATASAGLVRTVERNRAYFAAARTAADEQDLQAIAQPLPVPDDDLAAIEQIVFVSSGRGSPNCTGHGVPMPSGSAASSPAPS